MLCLRVDLDYVPWDTPDAEAFGHGEPAMLLRLLDLARQEGIRLHFFASNRVLRAFPATAETVLNEGHDLDWLCKHPGRHGARWAEAQELFRRVGHQAKGLAVRTEWPEHALWPAGLTFLSAIAASVPADEVRWFPVEVRGDREAARAGVSVRTWSDSVRALVRGSAERVATVVVRPQVLAKWDPKLSTLREILDEARHAKQTIDTLRRATV